jgi:hypothetical protein
MSIVKLPANYESLSKSQKCALRSRGNANAAKNATRAFLRKRIVLHPEDTACVRAGERLTDELLAESADTAVSRALATQAGLARCLTLIALSEAVRHRGNEKGSKARAEVARHMASERLAVQTLGASPRTAKDEDAFALMKPIQIEGNPEQP